MKKVLIISAVCLFIDQLIKGVLSVLLEYNQSVEIIKNFLNFTLVKNTGAAFSIMQQNTTFLILLTFAVLFAIYFSLIKNHELKNDEKITYGILIGGILGNFIDRIINGYVIDYVHFYFLEYNFPIFNFADICIVVSIMIIIINTIRRKE